MGVLQSCQGPSQRGLQVEIDRLLLTELSHQKISTEDYFYKKSNIRLYGDLLYKKGSKTEFVLQTKLINRAAPVISQALKIYISADQFLAQKGAVLKLQNPITDINRIQRTDYVGSLQGKGQMIIKAIPFSRYEEDSFKKGLYQIAMLRKALKQENNRFSYHYYQAFVVESGVDKEGADKSLVIFGQNANATLSQLINYRKLGNNHWGQTQFGILCYQLVRCVSQIHRQGIAHRDIRPSNFYYCPQKQGFGLGGFQNAVNVENDPRIGYNLEGVPYYLPPHLNQIGKRQDFSQYYNYNPKHVDIYALAVTLLNCLFLDQVTPPSVLSGSLNKYQRKWSFVSVLKQMMKDPPIGLDQVLMKLGTNDGILNEKTLIEAMRFRSRPQQQQFVNRRKSIAEGYYKMFMYDQWVQQINQVIGYYEIGGNQGQLAVLYRQIAEVYAHHGHTQMMKNYYKKASNSYLSLANSAREDGKPQEALRLLQKGIDCNRKGQNGQPNQQLSLLLNKLAMAYHTKGDYEIARAFQEQSVQICGKVYGANSTQYAEILIDSAKIQSQFQEFKQAQTMLKAALRVTQKIKQQNAEVIKVRARILQALGSNYRMKALQRKDKTQVYKKKAQDSLLDALALAQGAQGNISPLVGSIMLSLGNVYFDRRQFQKAKKAYEKSLIIKQHTAGKRETVEVGQCLTYLANSQKCLAQFQKAISHYDQAIQVFRKAYGNDHNQNTAVALGNLGLVYKQLGQSKQQKEYLSLAKTILKDLFGEQCPDYQYFDRQSR